MDNNFMDKLPNDKFTIEDSRSVSNIRFILRDKIQRADVQKFIQDTINKEIEGIENIEFEDNNHDICLTVNTIPDKDKLDNTIYYIMNRLYDKYVKDVKGMTISQLYSIIYIGNHIYIYL